MSKTVQLHATEHQVYPHRQGLSSSAPLQVDKKVTEVVLNASSHLRTDHAAYMPTYSDSSSIEDSEPHDLRNRSRSTPMYQHQNGCVVQKRLHSTAPITTSEEQKPRSRSVNHMPSSSQRMRAAPQHIVTSSEQHKKVHNVSSPVRNDHAAHISFNIYSDSSSIEDTEEESQPESRIRSKSTPMHQNQTGFVVQRRLHSTTTSEEPKPRSRSVNHMPSSSQRTRTASQLIVTSSEQHKKKHEPSLQEEIHLLGTLYASMSSMGTGEHASGLPQEAVERLTQLTRQLNGEFLNQFDRVLSNNPEYHKESEQIQKKFKELCEQTTQFYKKISVLSVALNHTDTYFVLNEQLIDKSYLCNALGVYLHKDKENIETIQKNDEFNFARLMHNTEGEHLARALRRHFSNHYTVFKTFLEVAAPIALFSIDSKGARLWIQWEENSILANEMVFKLPQELIVDLNLSLAIKSHLQELVKLRDELPCVREKKGIRAIEAWVQILIKGQNRMDQIYVNRINSVKKPPQQKTKTMS